MPKKDVHHTIFKIVILFIILSFFVMVYSFFRVTFGEKTVELPEKEAKYLEFLENRFREANSINSVEKCETDLFVTKHIKNSIPCLIDTIPSQLKFRADSTKIPTKLTSSPFHRIIQVEEETTAVLVPIHFVNYLETAVKDKESLILQSEIDLLSKTDLRGISVFRLKVKLSSKSKLFVPSFYFLQLSTPTASQSTLIANPETANLLRALLNLN